MDNTINLTIIEKVVIKKAAIFKDICMLPPLFEDKFTKEQICQQNENTQKQNLENNLNEPEKRIDLPQNDIMNETKIVNEQESLNTTTQIKSGIYKIVNKIDGKYYVGSSKSIKKRWIEHKRRLINNDHHNDHLQNTFNKHGFDIFDFMIIESVDIKNLKDIEQKYLDIAKTEQDKCYNLNFESTGGDLSEYSKIKISNALKGRRLSQQTRDKISNSKGGSVYPDDSTYYREYRRLNIDRIKSRDKEYRMRNRDKINEKKRLARKLKKVQTAVDNQTQI